MFKKNEEHVAQITIVTLCVCLLCCEINDVNCYFAIFKKGFLDAVKLISR